MTLLIQTLISGVLIGAVYALMASGLTLIFGVMRVINLAHGALAILAAFLAWTLFGAFGIDPLLAVPIVTVVMFGIGYLLYVGSVRFVRGAHVSSTVLVAFGIALLAEGVMGFVWGNTSHVINAPYRSGSIVLGPFYIRQDALIAAAVAVAVLLVLQLVLQRTWTGRAIRASSSNEGGALLVGVGVNRVAALSFAIGIATLGGAGAMIGVIYPFVPGSHYQWIARLLAIVVLGGLGSLSGAVIGAMVIGIGELLATAYIGAQWPVAVPFLVIFIVLLVRPQGILGSRLREDAVA